VRSSPLKRSGMDHTVFTLQTQHTYLHLVSVHKTAPPLTSDSSHLIATCYSFIDPFTHLSLSWRITHINGYGTHHTAGQRPTFYHWSTPLTRSQRHEWRGHASDEKLQHILYANSAWNSPGFGPPRGASLKYGNMGIFMDSPGYQGIALGIFVPRGNQCCCPRGKSLSSRILEDQLSLTNCYCSWTTNLKIVKDFAFCKQSVTYDHVVHKLSYLRRAWGYLLI